jgi:hypothetical protein
VLLSSFRRAFSPFPRPLSSLLALCPSAPLLYRVVWHVWNGRTGRNCTLGCLDRLASIVRMPLPSLAPAPAPAPSAPIALPEPPGRPGVSHLGSGRHAPSPSPSPSPWSNPFWQALAPTPPAVTSLSQGLDLGLSAEAAACYVTWTAAGEASFSRTAAFCSGFMTDAAMHHVLWASDQRPELAWAR